jgi:hypothetical protein
MVGERERGWLTKPHRKQNNSLKTAATLVVGVGVVVVVGSTEPEAMGKAIVAGAYTGAIVEVVIKVFPLENITVKSAIKCANYSVSSPVLLAAPLASTPSLGTSATLWAYSMGGLAPFPV